MNAGKVIFFCHEEVDSTGGSEMREVVFRHSGRHSAKKKNGEGPKTEIAHQKTGAFSDPVRCKNLVRAYY
jgi:hypothetical protein